MILPVGNAGRHVVRHFVCLSFYDWSEVVDTADHGEAARSLSYRNPSGRLGVLL